MADDAGIPVLPDPLDPFEGGVLPSSAIDFGGITAVAAAIPTILAARFRDLLLGPVVEIALTVVLAVAGLSILNRGVIILVTKDPAVKAVAAVATAVK